MITSPVPPVESGCAPGAAPVDVLAPPVPVAVLQPAATKSTAAKQSAAMRCSQFFCIRLIPLMRMLRIYFNKPILPYFTTECNPSAKKHCSSQKSHHLGEFCDEKNLRKGVV
jgi:hypothetical protein